MKNKFERSTGQAMIEYLLVFAFMALIAINFFRWGQKYVNESIGMFAGVLSQELSVGVCEKACFFNGYRN